MNEDVAAVGAGAGSVAIGIIVIVLFAFLWSGKWKAKDIATRFKGGFTKVRQRVLSRRERARNRRD